MEIRRSTVEIDRLPIEVDERYEALCSVRPAEPEELPLEIECIESTSPQCDVLSPKRDQVAMEVEHRVWVRDLRAHVPGLRVTGQGKPRISGREAGAWIVHSRRTPWLRSSTSVSSRDVEPAPVRDHEVGKP